MKTVAITGCNGSVGHRVVLYFLNQQHCNVLGIDVSPLVDSLTKVLADEVGLKVQNDRAGERFAFAKVDLKNWDDTLACLKAGIKGDGDQKQDQRIDGIVHLGAFKDPTDYVVQTHNTNVVVNYNVLRAAAELKITRVAVASSINVFPLAYSLDENMKYDYFPVDEKHPNRIDEPYGLSKVIGELQASSLCARYPFLRIASLRIHWSVPSLEEAQAQSDPHEDNTRKELWGWIQEDEGARAFWLGLTVGDSDSESRGASGAGQGGRGWKGHEVFNIAAPTTRCPQVGSETLRQKYFPNVPVREGVFKVEGRNGFFDCSKAERMLGWVHK